MKLEATKTFRAVKIEKGLYEVTVERRKRVIGYFSIKVADNGVAAINKTFFINARYCTVIDMRTAEYTVNRKLSNDKKTADEIAKYNSLRIKQRLVKESREAVSI